MVRRRRGGSGFRGKKFTGNYYTRVMGTDFGDYLDQFIAIYPEEKIMIQFNDLINIFSVATLLTGILFLFIYFLMRK